MRNTIAIIAAALLSGCAYNYPFSHVSGGMPPVSEVPSSQYTVVNNSGFKLMVYQDGKPLGELALGQVMPIKGGFLWSKTVVTVTGHFPDGTYVGSGTWIFECGIPEAWSVTKLRKPERP